MLRTRGDLPERLVSAAEVALFLGVSYCTLAKHRIYGTGPSYIKIGGKIAYRAEDVLTWLENGVKQKTADGAPNCLAAIRNKSDNLVPYAGKKRRKRSEDLV